MPTHATGAPRVAGGHGCGASVVVVGGGVMGCSIAFHLAERGADVLVLERGTVCSGMTARSGALVRMHYTNEPEARMALTGLGYFQDWKERVGGWCGFTVTGAAVLVGPGEGERLRRNVAMLRRVGVDTEAVAPADLAAEHPELDLAGVEMAAVEPGSGYADPVATTFAFASRAVDLGARIGQGVAVRGLVVAGDRVVGVDTADGRVGADAVVLACGPWVDPLARTAGFELGITPERSQIAFFRRPGAARRHPVVIDGVLGTYFRPHGGELSLLGVEAGHHIEVEAIDREVEGYDHEVVAPALGRLAGRVPSFAGAPVRPRPPRRLRHLGRQPGRARRRPRGGRAVRGRRVLGHRVQEVPGRRRLHGRAGHRGQGHHRRPPPVPPRPVRRGRPDRRGRVPPAAGVRPPALRGNRSAWAGSDQSAGLAIYTP